MRSVALPRFSSKISGFISYVILTDALRHAHDRHTHEKGHPLQAYQS